MKLSSETKARLLDRLALHQDRHRNQPQVQQLESSDSGRGESDETVLEITVEVSPTDAAHQTWLITLDFSEDAPNLLIGDPTDECVQTAALIIRANIDEWWATKDREPVTAAMGRRLHY
ncbi:hypothetical protein [Streptomyces sp. NPDC019890]|uniref:hypothetical protein n=1 Tax=Streptomyces sp. NPDC019890 TaxID=3365064 RepID=UPI00384DB9E7